MEKKDVVEQRNYLFKNSLKKVKVNKGDKRVHTPRLCVVCTRPLSSFIFNDNKYIATRSHLHFHIYQGITVDICEDVNSCYRTLTQKGELTDGDV